MSKDEQHVLSNIATINIKKVIPTSANISDTSHSNGKNSIDLTNHINSQVVIKTFDNNSADMNKGIRKDFYKTDINKKGKKHKVTWLDKINKNKKDVLIDIVNIVSFKNYNGTIQDELDKNQNKKSFNSKTDKEETVKCKCVIF